MPTVDVTSLSSKGQIVIPGSIRDKLHLESGAKLMVLSDGENILLKPIAPVDKTEFDRLRKVTDRFVKEHHIQHTAVKTAIKKVRAKGASR